MSIRIFISYQDKQRIFESQAEQVVIGRPKEGLEIDVDLTPDLAVSRPHARIWVEDGHYWVEDLGSGRGTLVSGEEIKGAGKRRLNPDDTVQIGSTILRVEFPVEGQDVGRSKAEIDSAATILAGQSDKDGHVEVRKSIAADSVLFSAQEVELARATERLSLLYELPFRFAEQARLDALLQTIVERLVSVIPGATRGALLVHDRATNELLLKAHVPRGKPSVSMTLAQRAMEKREGFIWQRGEDVTFSLQESSCLSGMYAPLLWENEVFGVVSVDSPSCDRVFDEEDLRLLLAVARYAAMALANRHLQEALQQKAALLARLLTNFSPKIRENLLKKARAGKLRLGGEKSEVTVLSSDIRGFTRMSATMDAGELVEMLNEYFAVLVSAIFQHDGAVDKFIGDAILAVFGSPEPDPAQYLHAVCSAVDMQAAVKRLNEERSARRLATCDIGIGIDCGEVLHGFVGSPDRMEFTVIGDAVNRTSRFCDAAQGGEILISPELHQHVWRYIVAEPASIPTKHEGTFAAYRVSQIKFGMPAIK